jgi:queuine tRNA-ribosyltransferase
MMTPELSMTIQRALGADIVMCFDECPALPATKEKLEQSMERTLRWAKRCLTVELKEHQHLFAIIQGGLDLSLRQRCLEKLRQEHFSGFALGGLSVGEKNQEMVDFCRDFVPSMPKEKPRYLMGVGTPIDILNGIRSGIDMFDCVYPTRNARNGQVFTTYGAINIKKALYEKDVTPLDVGCGCFVCARYTKSYVRHLFKVGETLASTLMSYHNLWFMLELVRAARTAILEQRFEHFFQKRIKQYSQNA